MKKNNLEIIILYLDKHNDIAKILVVGLILGFVLHGDISAILTFFYKIIL